MRIHPFARIPTAAAAVAALFLLLGGPAPAAARAPRALATPTGSAKQTTLQRIQRMASRLNAEGSTPEGEKQVLASLSAQLHVSADTLQTQKQEWGVGYGDLAMIYGFARGGRLQTVPERVLEMRRSGMDWEAIAKELGVKVDAVATRMNRQQRGATGKASSPAARAAAPRAGTSATTSSGK
jgi:hypothetical protein